MYVCDSDYPEPQHVPPQCYASPSNSLPSLPQIEAWALDTMFSYPVHESFGWFQASVLHFAKSYYESQNELPLVSIDRNLSFSNLFFEVLHPQLKWRSRKLQAKTQLMF